MKDPGAQVVEHLRAAFEPGRPWCEDEPAGFSWWPHVVRQRVQAEPARADDAVRGHAETGLVRGVQGTGERFALLARQAAADPGLSTLRWNGETGEVSLRAAVIARPMDWAGAARRLAHAALLQVGDAARLAPALARGLGGEVASPREGAGTRGEPDALVEAWRPYAERGAKESPLLGEPMTRALAMDPKPWRNVTGSSRGLDAELPCAAPGETPGVPAVGLLRLVASQPHPRLGSGLLAVLQPPVDTEPDPQRVFATAALLNEGESREWVDADQLGGWCVHPSQGLVYASFVPALACDDGVLERQAWQMAQRARWARAFLRSTARARQANSVC